jgi:hypothetical protein
MKFIFVVRHRPPISIYGFTALVDIGRFFSFLIHTQSVGLLDQPVIRSLPTHRTTQTQNKRKQTLMHRVGFEPTISVFQRAKAVQAVDPAATVIDRHHLPVVKLRNGSTLDSPHARQTGNPENACRDLLTYLLTHGAEPFLRSH